MLKEIVLDKNVLPILLDVPFEQFQYEYIKAKKYKKNQNLTYVYKALLPTLNHWANCFENDLYYDNITIYTCLRLLQADDKTPGSLNNKLTLLKDYLSFFDLSFINIVEEAFLLHMNKESYIPYKKYSKEKDLFFYIAKEIKMFIFSLFRKYINYQFKRNIIKSYKSSKVTFDFYTESYLDIACLETIPLDIYRSFLYSLLTQKEYKTTNYTKKEQETLLCQLIKTLLSNN
jgi:hypothetical protein